MISISGKRKLESEEIGTSDPSLPLPDSSHDVGDSVHSVSLSSAPEALPSDSEYLITDSDSDSLKTIIHQMKSYLTNQLLSHWYSYSLDEILSSFDCGYISFETDEEAEKAVKLTENQKEMKKIIKDCRNELIKQQLDWGVTDCDRLDLVEKDLKEKNILFVQNIQTTPSSCWYEINEAIQKEKNGDRFLGAAYYHFQTTDRAIESNVMNIYYGTTDKGDEKQMTSLMVKRAVIQSLRENGLSLPTHRADRQYRRLANGSFELLKPFENCGDDTSSAIEISPFYWQKRISEHC